MIGDLYSPDSFGTRLGERASATNVQLWLDTVWVFPSRHASRLVASCNVGIMLATRKLQTKKNTRMTWLVPSKNTTCLVNEKARRLFKTFKMRNEVKSKLAKFTLSGSRVDTR